MVHLPLMGGFCCCCLSISERGVRTGVHVRGVIGGMTSIWMACDDDDRTVAGTAAVVVAVVIDVTAVVRFEPASSRAPVGSPLDVDDDDDPRGGVAPSVRCCLPARPLRSFGAPFGVLGVASSAGDVGFAGAAADFRCFRAKGPRDILNDSPPFVCVCVKEENGLGK